MDPKKWTNGIRQLVSKKKRRHKEPGYDLDLSYITSRIIAMGFPSIGNEGIYRNHAEHVTDFLSVKHGDKVKVYNLCSERDYPISLFEGRVAKYPFDDHNPPPMQMFLPFCEDVREWLDTDPENVVAIHCKAGKGRTGVMICAYLLYVGAWENADECMAFYGTARTYNGKGVTIPSQKRFIRHFAELCTGVRAEVKNNIGVLTPYLDTATENNEDAKADESDDSDDDVGRESSRIVSLKGCTDTLELRNTELEKGDILTVNGDQADTSTESKVDRSVIVTPKGTTFTDYSESGTSLEDNLKRAREAANSSKVGRRPTYAQASFWMTSHQDIVHKIFLETGIPGGLLGSSQSDGGEVMLALEDVKPSQIAIDDSKPGSERKRGQVLPAVVLAVVEVRLSAVPKLNIRGSFQPIIRIQGAGYNILSTDFLPQSTYKGKGAITFAIPGINVVDEVLFTIYNKNSFGKEKIAQFWLHTAFIKNNNVVLKKCDLDKINKDKRDRKYPSDFNIQVSFDEVLFEVDDIHAVQEENV